MLKIVKLKNEAKLNECLLKLEFKCRSKSYYKNGPYLASF